MSWRGGHRGNIRVFAMVINWRLEKKRSYMQLALAFWNHIKSIWKRTIINSKYPIPFYHLSIVDWYNLLNSNSNSLESFGIILLNYLIFYLFKMFSERHNYIHEIAPATDSQVCLCNRIWDIECYLSKQQWTWWGDGSSLLRRFYNSVHESVKI